MGQRARHADQQARGGGEERGEGPGGDERAEDHAQGAGRHHPRQDEDDRIGLARRVETGCLQAAQHGEHRGEDVEAAEQQQHEGGGPAGRLAVAVGVEADEDVGEAHGAEHGGQEHAVGRRQRVVGPSAQVQERRGPRGPAS